MYKIAQTNLQGSYTCQAELETIIARYKINIVLVQELYIVEGRMPIMNNWETLYVGNGAKFWSQRQLNMLCSNVQDLMW